MFTQNDLDETKTKIAKTEEYLAELKKLEKNIEKDLQADLKNANDEKKEDISQEEFINKLKNVFQNTFANSADNQEEQNNNLLIRFIIEKNILYPIYCDFRNSKKNADEIMQDKQSNFMRCILIRNHALEKLFQNNCSSVQNDSAKTNFATYDSMLNELVNNPLTIASQGGVLSKEDQPTLFSNWEATGLFYELLLPYYDKYDYPFDVDPYSPNAVETHYRRLNCTSSEIKPYYEEYGFLLQPEILFIRSKQKEQTKLNQNVIPQK